MTTKKEYVAHAWETVDCLFCESDQKKPYERFGSKLQYQSVLCENCGLVYLSPRPKYDQVFIDAAYATYYQYAETVELNNDTKVLHSNVELFRKELAYIEKFDPVKSAVLDVGSGMGTFLYAAKSYYKEAVGLDVSVNMARFVEKQLGVKVFICQLENFVYDHKFSMIHMSHVLEHVPNPVEWLLKAKELLDSRGVLVINIPNKFSATRRFQHLLYKLKIKKQFSSKWKDPSLTPDHLFEPTILSMKHVLMQTGYEILDYYTYSRKDPTSSQSIFSRFYNRFLKIGSNLTFICRRS